MFQEFQVFVLGNWLEVVFWINFVNCFYISCFDQFYNFGDIVFEVQGFWDVLFFGQFFVVVLIVILLAGQWCFFVFFYQDVVVFVYILVEGF